MHAVLYAMIANKADHVNLAKRKKTYLHVIDAGIVQQHVNDEHRLYEMNGSPRLWP